MMDTATVLNLGIALGGFFLSLLTVVCGGVWIVGTIRTTVAVAVAEIKNLDSRVKKVEAQIVESDKELEAKVVHVGDKIEHRINDVGRQVAAHGESIVRLETLVRKGSDTYDVRKKV